MGRTLHFRKPQGISELCSTIKWLTRKKRTAKTHATLITINLSQESK